MTSSYNIFPIAVLIGVTFSEVGCAATDVYSHAGSTTEVTQSGGGGPNSTQVTRTPDGQKVVSRNGSNVDISVQSSGSSGDGGNSEGRFTRSSPDCVDDGGGFFGALRRIVWPSSTKCSNSGDIPTSEEY